MSVFPGITAERRAYPRHPLRTHAVLILADGRQIEARTLDVGKGGMAIVSNSNPPIGSTFGIRVTLPTHPRGNAVFEARVRVANSVLDGAESGFRIGIEFLALEPAARAVLERALA